MRTPLLENIIHYEKTEDNLSSTIKKIERWVPIFVVPHDTTNSPFNLASKFKIQIVSLFYIHERCVIVIFCDFSISVYPGGNIKVSLSN
jgi:hypothetical protein